MIQYLTAMGAILLMLLAWVVVQRTARLFAARHPEFGPAKEEGKGCGSGCLCAAGRTCSRRQ